MPMLPNIHNIWLPNNFRMTTYDSKLLTNIIWMEQR